MGRRAAGGRDGSCAAKAGAREEAGAGGRWELRAREFAERVKWERDPVGEAVAAARDDPRGNGMRGTPLAIAGMDFLGGALV